MCNNWRLRQLLLVIILAIGPGESRSGGKLPEPPQDSAAGLHLNNVLDDCGEDSHSSCDSWAKSGECEKDPEVKQSCSFSCSLSVQLWEAAQTGNKSTVEITITAGANPICAKTIGYVREYHVYNYTAIHMAASAGYPSIIETLLNAGVDVNLQTTEGKTPIYVAAAYGNIDTLNILIENNANVNIPKYGGMTPLMAAAWAGQLSVAKALISANASIDVTGGWLRATALHYAVWESNQDVVLLLIEHNANHNIPDSGGVTPLMQAARIGELNITRALINANASLDVTRGNSNSTALHYAVEENNQEMVVLLMDNGADSRIQNKLGYTPADLARSEGHNQLADLIESYPTTHRLILSR